MEIENRKIAKRTAEEDDFSGCSAKRSLPQAEEKICALLTIGYAAEMIKKRSSRRKVWCRSWIAKRTAQGCYDNLMRELALKDKEDFRRWLRMDTTTFQWLLAQVSPKISKKDTNMRQAISPGEKLAITLRYLATGETQSSLSYQFRVAQPTISLFLHQVCKEIYDALQKEYLVVPKHEENWQNIADKFWQLWNFPACIGALDGKHVDIVPPPGSGSTYYNYKGRFSIVLLAVVDADLQFLYVDVGRNGRVSDGGVWANFMLKQHLESGNLHVPESFMLPGTSVKVPAVFVADDAFPLSKNIMKPYPGKSLNMAEKIFNYRLSRARRVVENAFGILAARFRNFRSTILLSPEKARVVVLAACAMHNLLRRNSPTLYTPQASLD